MSGLDYFESQEIAGIEGVDSFKENKIEEIENVKINIERIVLNIGCSDGIESSVVRTFPRTMEIRRSLLVYEELNKEGYESYRDIYKAMTRFKSFKLSDLVGKFGPDVKDFFESLANHGILLAKGDGEDRGFTMNPANHNHLYDFSKKTALYFAAWLVSQDNIEYENFYKKIAGKIIFLSTNNVFYNGEIIKLEDFEKKFIKIFEEENNI